MVDAVGISVGWDRLASSAQGDYPNVQSIAIGAAAAQTIPFSSLATVVTLRATVNCWFRVGGTAAAHVAGSDYLPANTTWMLKIPQGAILSFIQDSVGGWVSVTPAVNQFPNPTPGPGPVTAPTWNPADKSATVTLTNGNLTAACASGADVGVRTTKGYSASKVFWEVTNGAGLWGSDHGYGLANLGASLTSVANSATGGVICYLNNWWWGGADHGVNMCPGGGVQNITIMVAVDLANSLWWAQSSNNANQWNVASGPGTANPATGVGGLSYAGAGLNATLYPVVVFNGSGDAPFTLNTVGPFVLTPPAGFTAIGTL